jgi:thioredoxin reductase
MRQAEVVIVGGGPAGLSAALVLGRCRRDVILYDGGRYRNEGAHGVHGFLTRDGIPPHELREIAQDQIRRYPSVEIVADTVADIQRTEDGFIAITASGSSVACHALLLATGFADVPPPIAGAHALHGRLVMPCPYCDGWEHRDTPLAAFSHPDDSGARFALVVAQWSSDVLFCAEEPPRLSTVCVEQLRARGVRIEPRRPVSVERDGEGVRIYFAEGEPVWRRAMFYHLGGCSAAELAKRLGAGIDERGGMEVDRKQASSIPGLYAAGDTTRDVLLAIVAAGEGCAAGVSINEYLVATSADRALAAR